MNKVILYYDYFLTLSTEVDGYWCAGSHSWASIVFLVNRYVALLGHVPLLYVLFRGPCMMKVRLKSSGPSGVLSYSLLPVDVSIAIPTLPPLGPPADRYREPFIVTYHSILIWVLTSLTQGTFYIIALHSKLEFTSLCRSTSRHESLRFVLSK